MKNLVTFTERFNLFMNRSESISFKIVEQWKDDNKKSSAIISNRLVQLVYQIKSIFRILSIKTLEICIESRRMEAPLFDLMNKKIYQC